MVPTNADYNDGINIVNIERKNEANSDITIKITDPGISTIAFSGYTGTDAAADGFTGSGNMDDANIKIWYKPDEAKSYDFTGNLLEGIEVQYNKRWSGSGGTCVDANGIFIMNIPMSTVLGKQIKLTGFSSSAPGASNSTIHIINLVTPTQIALQMKPLWDNSNCVANNDGTYTITVPNDANTTAHQMLVMTLVVDNTRAISASDVTNCKVEIL